MELQGTIGFNEFPGALEVTKMVQAVSEKFLGAS